MAQIISFNYHSVFFKMLVDGGYVTFGVGGTPKYHFYQNDHLGNVRVVSDANGTVEEVNHYYPYGALMGESQNTTTQPYKYNGKELDRSFGLDWYDYGARWMDGVGGRWSSMDPLCEKYYDVSPYAYCAGNPVNRVDMNGRDWYSRNGNLEWKNDVNDIHNDENGLKWKRVDRTLHRENKYYSLFGQVYSIHDKDYRAIVAIDNAIMDYIKIEYEIQKSYKKHEEYDGKSPSYDFSNMYPKKVDRSILRLNDYHMHYITYGDKRINGRNARITQVYEKNNAYACVTKMFREMSRPSFGLGMRESGIGIEFKNKSGLDVVSIIFSEKAGQNNQEFYWKLVNSYK